MNMLLQGFVVVVPMLVIVDRESRTAQAFTLSFCSLNWFKTLLPTLSCTPSTPTKNKIKSNIGSKLNICGFVYTFLVIVSLMWWISFLVIGHYTSQSTGYYTVILWLVWGYILLQPLLCKDLYVRWWFISCFEFVESFSFSFLFFLIRNEDLLRVIWLILWYHRWVIGTCSFKKLIIFSLIYTVHVYTDL